MKIKKLNESILSINEDNNSNIYKALIFDNTACAQRREMNIDDLDDFKEITLESSNEQEAFFEVFYYLVEDECKKLDKSDIEYIIEDYGMSTVDEIKEYLDQIDISGGDRVVLNITCNDKIIFDYGISVNEIFDMNELRNYMYENDLTPDDMDIPDCLLQYLHFEESNEDDKEDENNETKFSKDGKTLIELDISYKGYYEVPDSVTRIGGYAFDHCKSLTGVTIPDSVTSIGESAFKYCESLETVTIPDSVTSIGNNAFSLCDSLTNVTMGNSVTSIGRYAFYGCKSLKSITIPDSVTSIGNEAFYGCDSLIINCRKDSYAERYAKENNIPVKLIESKNNIFKFKKLDESSTPSKETLDDCLQDYVNNAFGYDGVEDYVDTQYPMHPQEFKAEVVNYLKQNIINESISESISSQEPVMKFSGRSSHTFTKDKKWEVDFDEKGNIVARTRKGKPQYFKGHINDKTNSFPSTDEDNIILAARKQHSLKFGKGSGVTESTHAVCYSLDGGRTEEIEFKGTEDECYQYIEDTQAEQDDEFGVDAPERFIKRLTEATQVKEALNESRPDKDHYQNNSTSKVTIKYGNSNKEIQTCKPIKVTNDQLKQYKDNYSFVDIINESNNIKHVKRNKIEEDIDDDKWIIQRYLDVEIPDTLSRLIDFLPNMYESDIKIAQRYCRTFYNQLNSMLSYYVAHKDEPLLKEHVEITALGGPEQGPKVGLSSLLTDAIKDEWEAIETYNSLAVTARAEGFEDIANKIDEINTDENTHVGKLQELLKTISPNAEAIDFGQKYANDIDDMSEDDVLAYTDRYM